MNGEMQNPQPQQGVFSEFDEQQMSSDSQERLEDYIIRGYNIIYHEKQPIANMVSKDTKNKVQNVANAGNMVAQKIDLDTRHGGEEPFGDDIKVVGGYHLVEKIIQLAEHKGAGAFEPAEKKMALQGAYQKYIEMGIQNRTIDPVELAKATEQMQPGSVSESIADMPGEAGMTPPGAAPAGPQGPPPEGMPPQGPPQQGPPMAAPQEQAPQQPQGLLTRPTALQQMQGGM